MNKHVRLALFRSAVGIIIGVGLILITVVRATTPSAFELNWATIDGSGGTSSGGTTLWVAQSLNTMLVCIKAARTR